MQLDLNRFLDQSLTSFRNHDTNRRQFLGQIGKAALVAGVAGPWVPGLIREALAQDSIKIRYDGQGGRWQKAFVTQVLERFSKETGVPITEGSLANADELLAKVQLARTGDYNVAQIPMESDALRFHRLGLFASLDEDKIPALKHYMVDRAVEAFRRIGDGKLVSVPVTESGVWVVYNKEKISAAEVEKKGFGILLDPQYDRVRTGENNYVKRIVYAALQTGQDHNNITDFDALWEAVRESKARIVKYFQTNAEHSKLFASGEVWLADGRFNATNNLKKEGYPVEGWPRQGTYKMYTSFGCFKGTHMASFYQLINLLLDPEVMIPLAIEGGSVPLFDPTKVNIPAELSSLPGFDPSGTAKDVRLLDPFYWERNRDEFLKRYTREIARA